MIFPDNNTAERAMKPVAIGRKNWMFAGSQRGGHSMAIAFTLFERIQDHPINRIDELLPWAYQDMIDV